MLHANYCKTIFFWYFVFHSCDVFTRIHSMGRIVHMICIYIYKTILYFQISLYYSIIISLFINQSLFRKTMHSNVCTFAITCTRWIVFFHKNILFFICVHIIQGEWQVTNIFSWQWKCLAWTFLPSFVVKETMALIKCCSWVCISQLADSFFIIAFSDGWLYWGSYYRISPCLVSFTSLFYSVGECSLRYPI